MATKERGTTRLTYTERRTAQQIRAKKRKGTHKTIQDNTREHKNTKLIKEEQTTDARREDFKKINGDRCEDRKG